MARLQTTITNFERKDTPLSDYFNNYFTSTLDVAGNVNDSLIAFFEQIADNRESAIALASAVIYTSQAQGTDPMEILTEFANMEKNKLNAYLCMFLNLNRVGTSYLGINNQPVQNKYVQRTILP
jgi:hypothetical protein